MADRIDKVNDEVLKALATMTRTLKDPRLDGKFFTLTRADVSRDFRFGKIYCSVMGDNREKVIDGLNSAAPLLRRDLGKAVKLHQTPELTFILDTSLDHSERINQVLSEVLSVDD